VKESSLHSGRKLAPGAERKSGAKEKAVSPKAIWGKEETPPRKLTQKQSSKKNFPFEARPEPKIQGSTPFTVVPLQCSEMCRISKKKSPGEKDRENRHCAEGGRKYRSKSELEEKAQKERDAELKRNKTQYFERSEKLRGTEGKGIHWRNKG